MFDTIHAKLAAAQCGGVDFLSYVPQFVDDWRPTRWGVGGKVLQGRGRLGNISVMASEQHLFLIGSLHKFAKGENVTPMTIKEAAATVGCLSDALCLPIKSANVTRFDFGACMVMGEPVEICLQALGGLVYKKKKTVEAVRVPILTGKRLTSLRYRMNGKGQNVARVLAFYDKTAEMKNTKGADAIPEDYRGANVLRAELRFCNMGGDSVKIADLCSPTIWRAAVSELEQTINQVEKVNTSEMSEAMFLSPTDYKKECVRMHALHLGGPAAAIEQVKARQRAKLINRKTAGRICAEIREACRYEPNVRKCSTVEEFNEKVKEAAERLRA